MQRILAIYAALIFIVSCSGHENGNITKTAPTTADSAALIPGLFPETNISNLHVYSPDDSINGNKFEGKAIDPGFYRFLKFDNNLTTLTSDTSHDELFSCYKFKMRPPYTGLIVRRPSQYVVSAIDLYIWNNQQNKVTGVMPLTDAFGDEGWFFVQDAWLKDVNNDKLTDIVIRRKDFDMDLDDTTKITKSDSLSVLLGNGKTFKPAVITIDTGKFQLHNWSDNHPVL